MATKKKAAPKAGVPEPVVVEMVVGEPLDAWLEASIYRAKEYQRGVGGGLKSGLGELITALRVLLAEARSK